MNEQIDLQTYENLLKKGIGLIFIPSHNLRNEKRGYLWIVLQRMLDQNSNIQAEVLDKLALATKKEFKLIRRAIRRYKKEE